MDAAAIKERQREIWGLGDYSYISRLLRPAAAALCDACAGSAGQEVLGVAAGDGNFALACAREGARVVASDISPAMVERGRAHSEAEGYPIESVEPDAEELVAMFTGRALIEACQLVEEGVCSVRDIDLGMMAGAGLDPRRGLFPPFWKADLEGLDSVLERIEQLEEKHGERFSPPATLKRLVAQGRLGLKSGQGFYPYPQPDEGYETAPVKLDTRGEVAIEFIETWKAAGIPAPDILRAMTIGRPMSSSTTSGRCLSIASTASSPSWAMYVLLPVISNSIASESAESRLSSTIRILALSRA